jgi:hypothetical protein
VIPCLNCCRALLLGAQSPKLTGSMWTVAGPAQTSGTNRCSPPGKKSHLCPTGDPGPGLPDSHTGPWGNDLFGRSHDSGFYNTYLVPFGKSIRITLTDPVASSDFWYMVRGVENLPLVVSGLELPISARLKLIHTQ